MRARTSSGNIGIGHHTVTDREVVALLLLACGLAIITSCSGGTVSAVATASGVSATRPTPSHCDGFDAARAMVPIAAGDYVPLYGSDTLPVHIDGMLMDAYPVTQADYLEFVRRNPQWRRSQVKALFADPNYLRSWANDTTLGEERSPLSPVTSVSWFAANAYCSCAGKRLATVHEWEYVAMADSFVSDARNDAAFTAHILSWYGRRPDVIGDVGTVARNRWGVYDLHGSVWEWTADFNSVLMDDDARRGTSGNYEKFCGDASLGATDLGNYAAFMRFAFRASLKARYSVHNLGFRCARSDRATTTTSS